MHTISLKIKIYTESTHHYRLGRYNSLCVIIYHDGTRCKVSHASHRLLIQNPRSWFYVSSLMLSCFTWCSLTLFFQISFSSMNFIYIALTRICTCCIQSSLRILPSVYFLMWRLSVLSTGDGLFRLLLCTYYFLGYILSVHTTCVLIRGSLFM